jgi:CBS domain-containing membrane protein
MSTIYGPTLKSVFLYMSKKVFTLSWDKNLQSAKELMDWARCRHAPVVNDQGELIGIVSRQDLLAASPSSVDENVTEVERTEKRRTIPLQKVMQSPVTTLTSASTIQEAASIMRSRKIGCLPVVDKGKLVGILTDSDLLEIVEKL